MPLPSLFLSRLARILRVRPGADVPRFAYPRWCAAQILEANDGSLRTFADIRADLEQGWPIKERLFADTGSRSTDIVQPFLGLTWCKKTKCVVSTLPLLLASFSPAQH